MEFVTTTRGAHSLVCQGYKFTLNRRTADGQTYWRCHDRSCPGRAVTDTTDQQVSCNNKHSHPPPPPPQNTAERAAEVVKERMKKKAKEETTSIPHIYHNVTFRRNETYYIFVDQMGLDEMGI